MLIYRCGCYAAALLCRSLFCRHIRHSLHCLSLPFRASVLTLSRGDTMKKPVLMFSLLSGTVLMFPRLTIASGLPAHTHTHTYTPEPKPAFQFEQPDKAYNTASVCFLGSANCGDAGFGSMGGDNGYKVDTVQQCGNEGYSVTSCSLPRLSFRKMSL